jgi:radical SAM-linked protein
MRRLFLSITKGEELRFLGHLDYLRTLERAVLRAGIPVAFSEGFNPHMKLSLDSALGVGVTADPLYLAMGLEGDMAVEKVKKNLSLQLPKGIQIHSIVEAQDNWPKFVAVFNEDAYEMEGPVCEGFDEQLAEKALKSLELFNNLPSFLYKRVTPKKIREMDVKPMILEPMKCSFHNRRAHLTFSLVRSMTGTVQPKDIWKMLAESFDMPWIPGEFICSRTGTYRRVRGKRLTLEDPGVFDGLLKGK